MNRRWLVTRSERIRRAKEDLEALGETAASKGGDATADKFRERDAEVAAAYDGLLGTGIQPAKAKPKIEKQFKISRWTLDKILRKKK